MAANQHARTAAAPTLALDANANTIAATADSTRLLLWPVNI